MVRQGRFRVFKVHTARSCGICVDGRTESHFVFVVARQQNTIIAKVAGHFRINFDDSRSVVEILVPLCSTVISMSSGELNQTFIILGRSVPRIGRFSKPADTFLAGKVSRHSDAKVEEIPPQPGENHFMQLRHRQRCVVGRLGTTVVGATRAAAQALLGYSSEWVFFVERNPTHYRFSLQRIVFPTFFRCSTECVGAVRFFL